jgi:DNA-binding transcriptional regulator YdaS (Cro superfamily)
VPAHRLPIAVDVRSQENKSLHAFAPQRSSVIAREMSGQILIQIPAPTPSPQWRWQAIVLSEDRGDLQVAKVHEDEGAQVQVLGLDGLGQLSGGALGDIHCEGDSSFVSSTRTDFRQKGEERCRD